MTRHPVKVQALPEDLRGEAPVDDRGRVDRPPAELREEIFRRFVAALEPLRHAGKLGGILMQMAPYVVPKRSSYDYLSWAREQLGHHTMLVEFRHRNRGTWYKRTGSTAERFDYLYSEAELGGWACTLRELADEGAETVYAMFNNNGRSAAGDVPSRFLESPAGEHVAQAPTNAAMLKALLEQASGPPASGG